MAKVKAVLELPEDSYLTLSASGYSKERVASMAREYLAAHLFQDKILSLGGAAEMAEMGLGDFIRLLDKMGIPVIDYDDEELGLEFEAVKELTQTSKKTYMSQNGSRRL